MCGPCTVCDHVSVCDCDCECERECKCECECQRECDAVIKKKNTHCVKMEENQVHATERQRSH